MKKSLTETYSDIRCAIAFIMRNERGISRHTITEAAVAATRVLRKVGKNPERRDPDSPDEVHTLALSLGFAGRKQPFPFRPDEAAKSGN